MDNKDRAREVGVPASAKRRPLNPTVVHPRQYYSTLDRDFGLCKALYMGKSPCPMGANCPNRHERLDQDEWAYLRKIGGARFANMEDFYNLQANIIEQTLFVK